jgi:cyanate lyase
MSPSSLTEKLFLAKREMGLSFSDLEAILGRDEVWIAALFYCQATASPEELRKLAVALALEL